MIQGTKRKLKLKKISIILAGVVIITGVFLFISVDNNLSVTHYTFETDKLEEPVRIAVIADLHNRLYGKEQEELISAINEQNPDIIVLIGDIGDEKKSNTGTIKLLEGIAEEYPCFYVLGNHEARKEKAGEFKALFREYGVIVLDGRHEVIEINGQLLNICGADDLRNGRARYEKQLHDAFSEIDDSLFTLLLLHRPERFPQVSEYNFDLMLAGHAHGGQWRFPNIIDGFYAPQQGLFPKYTCGFYTLDERTMLVSRGLANNGGIIPRIFNPPELVIVDILPIEN